MEPKAEASRGTSPSPRGRKQRNADDVAMAARKDSMLPEQAASEVAFTIDCCLPACCTGRCRSCCRLCHWALCRPASFLQRWCSATLWTQTLTGWLQKYVNRRTIAFYAIYEMVISVGLIVFYIKASKVAQLGSVLKSAQVIVMLNLLRAVSGLLGAWASWWRKVTRTRLYFVLLMVNLALSWFVVSPLWNTECRCELDWNRYTDPQCRALDEFKRPVRARSQPTCLLKETASGRRLGARRLSVGQGNDWGERLTGAEVTNVRALDDRAERAERLSQFNITEPGIRLRSRRNDAQEACSRWIDVNGSDAAGRLRTTLTRLQCGQSDQGDKGVAVTLIFDELQGCFRGPNCGAVAVHVRPKADRPDSAQMQLCRLEPMVLPFWAADDRTLAGRCGRAPGESCEAPAPVDDSLRDACWSFSVFFLKDLLAQVPEPDQNACTILVALGIFFLGVLNAFGIPMISVVYKFIVNHCGDGFENEDQFHVSFHTNASEDDEFEVGTWISLEARQRERRMSKRKSLAGAAAAAAASVAAESPSEPPDTWWGGSKPVNGVFNVQLAAMPAEEGLTPATSGVGDSEDRGRSLNKPPDIQVTVSPRGRVDA